MKTIIPYKQLMTPVWLDQNAEKTGPYNVMPEYYEIVNTTGSRYQRALRVELIPPGITASTSSCTVTITAALDPTIPLTNDHDPIFAISDKKSFMGFQTLDVKHSYTPCFRLEGNLNEETLKNRQQGSGPRINTTNYSSEIKMQFRPADKWGSCHTEEAGGLLNVASYQSSLDPSNGLYFEFYCHQAREVYRIRYIKVEVDMDH